VAEESNHTTSNIHGVNQADELARLVTAVENAAEAIVIADLYDQRKRPRNRSGIGGGLRHRQKPFNLKTLSQHIRTVLDQ
jgi:hypothetical protein